MSETQPSGPPGIQPALMRHTGFLISRMGKVAQEAFAARLQSLELTPRMWGALNVLDAQEAITQQALGKVARIDPSSMVATIDELEAKGLMQRRPHPSDRRANALHLTELGRQTLGRARELARGAQDELLAPLSAPEREQLHALLLRLALATAQPEASPAEALSHGPSG
ncbi:MAG: MarR family winged helix-turn-helix transcriptional regulator [Solirubrobacteraceae bacterium]